MRTSQQIDHALRFRFGAGRLLQLAELRAKSNRFADEAGLFVPMERVRDLFRRLGPQDARRASRILDQVAAHRNAVGTRRLGDDRRGWYGALAAALEDALDEVRATAAGVGRRIETAAERTAKLFHGFRVVTSGDLAEGVTP